MPSVHQVDYQKLLNDIIEEQKQVKDSGAVASYIPILADVNPDKLGVHLTTIDKQNFSAGDSEEKFSIQSIVKTKIKNQLSSKTHVF